MWWPFGPTPTGPKPNSTGWLPETSRRVCRRLALAGTAQKRVIQTVKPKRETRVDFCGVCAPKRRRLQPTNPALSKSTDTRSHLWSIMATCKYTAKIRLGEHVHAILAFQVTTQAEAMATTNETTPAGRRRGRRRQCSARRARKPSGNRPAPTKKATDVRVFADVQVGDHPLRFKSHSEMAGATVLIKSNTKR